MLKPRTAHLLTCASLLGLVCLIPIWEYWLNPMQPSFIWIALKICPLLFLLKFAIQKNNYVLQFSTLLIWFFFTEGVVRAYSDTNSLSARLAAIEAALALSYAIGAMLYLRPYKLAAKARSKNHD